ncbi:hypothetical protein [Noviherbaspirillum sp.]|uniref:hypothetical protein n=1 Tax=Noviherbaspirillum sp. TaxID=1926288 RepID=UPI002B4891F2|nr:hypothetical protein [Noviherbaspirillum sp.]HJV81155.1 hypothetical protein [Noviherbaspirillum sp.]
MYPLELPEAAMAQETIGEFDIEYSGIRLADVEGWGAYVAIYGPSHNPMHRNEVFPHQRVAVETVFPTERAAEEEARKIAMTLLKH